MSPSPTSETRRTSPRKRQGPDLQDRATQRRTAPTPTPAAAATLNPSVTNPPSMAANSVTGNTVNPSMTNSNLVTPVRLTTVSTPPSMAANSSSTATGNTETVNNTGPGETSPGNTTLVPPTAPATAMPAAYGQPWTTYNASPYHHQAMYGGGYAQQTPYGHHALHSQGALPHPSLLYAQNNYANIPSTASPASFAHATFHNTQPYSGQYQMQLPPVAAPAAQRTATTTPATFPAPAFGVDVSLLLQEPNALGSGSADVQRAPSQVVDVTPNIADGQTPATGNAPVPQGPSVDGATPTSPEKPPVDGAAGGKGDDSDEEYEEDAAGNIVKRTDIKGRHVSTLNNLHGWVDGVGRGLDGWDVARTVKMGPAFKEQRDATRAHNAMMRTVISRAEHLSTRTGSWLYIAAQHPASTAGFIHYASVKLRQNEAELAKLHEQAGRCMGALMDGSRKEVTKLSAEVREKDAEIKALEKKLLAAEASLAVKESDISMLGRAIALVRAGDPQALALLAQYSGEPSEEPSNTPLINV